LINRSLYHGDLVCPTWASWTKVGSIAGDFQVALIRQPGRHCYRLTKSIGYLFARLSS